MHRCGTRPYLKLADHNVAKVIIIRYSNTTYPFEASAYSGDRYPERPRPNFVNFYYVLWYLHLPTDPFGFSVYKPVKFFCQLCSKQCYYIYNYVK